MPGTNAAAASATSSPTRRVPSPTGWPRRRRPLADLRRRSSRRPTSWRGELGSMGDRAWVTGGPVVAAPTSRPSRSSLPWPSSGALFVPVNGLLGPDEADGHHRPVPAGPPGHRRRDATPPPGGAEPVSTSMDLAARAAGQDVTPVRRRGTVGPATPMSSSSPAAAPAAPRGRCCRTPANYLRTHPGALLEPRGAMVCPYPLFHMGAWTIALQQWQARTPWSSSVRRTPRRSARPWPATGPPGSTASRPSGSGSSTTSARRRGRSARVDPVRRHRHLGHPARAPRRHRARPCPTRTSASSTDRPRPGAWPASTTPTSGASPGAAGPRPPGSQVRIVDGRRAVGLERRALRRLPRRPGRHRRRASSTAGTAPATWPTRTATASSASWAGPGDVIRTGGETVCPPRSRRCWPSTPSVADVAVVGLPDPTWGEVVCAVVVPAPTGHHARPSRPSGSCAAARSPPSSTPAGSRSSSPAPDRVHRPGPAPPAGRVSLAGSGDRLQNTVLCSL